MPQMQLDMTVQAVYQLWCDLTTELAHIFDAHGVCDVVAHQVAKHTQTKTIVGIHAPEQPYYDVWICEPNGDTLQTRWQRNSASFDSLLALGHGDPIYVDKYSRSAAELVRSELWQVPHDGILCVSLNGAETNAYPTLSPATILCLVDPDDDCILNLTNLTPLALHITTYISRAYLRHQVNRQEVEFAVVSDISHALTSSLNLHDIFRQLRQQVRATINVESISLGLIEHETGDILFVNSLMGPLFDQLGPIRLRKGQGIAGWVATNNEPLIINNVYADRRFYAQVDEQSGFQTQSMICMPLQVEDRVIGVLQAINKKTGEFNETDLRLIQALGGPLTAAIENANLHTNVLSEKRRIETMFASMAEGLITTNPNGIVTEINTALLTLLRQKRAALIGSPVTTILPLDKGTITDLMAQILEKSDDPPQLAANLKVEGEEDVPILISGTPIHDKEGNVEEFIFVISDLRQIREVERMRDDFFHGIIHELRTPLATILMYARLLREGKAQHGTEKADRFLGVIERESDRLQKMVWQMLQLAKLEARELQRSFELVNLNALFEEMLPPLADRATEKGLLFRQRIPPALPHVQGNREMYRLIFRNLLTNAIKFTLSGTVKITAATQNGNISIAVQDDGIGIPQEAMPNLFRRFYRTQTAVSRGIAGTGLGLYMVKENVEHYNGRIDVQSEVDKGSTFTITLPVA